jgi:hypothetical protein
MEVCLSFVVLKLPVGGERKEENRKMGEGVEKFILNCVCVWGGHF